MRTILLLGYLLTGTLQAQTLSPTQLANSLVGGASRQPAVYSSQPETMPVKISAQPFVANTQLAQKQYAESLTIYYSSANQFADLRGDFAIIKDAAGADEDSWKWIGTAVIMERLNNTFKPSKEEYIRLKNRVETTTMTEPLWVNLFLTANLLRDIDTRVPSLKESGGVSSWLQVTANTPLTDLNGKTTSSRNVASLPFTVR